MPKNDLRPLDVSVVRDVPYPAGITLDKHGMAYTARMGHPTFIIDFSRSLLSTDEIVGYFEARLESEFQDLASRPEETLSNGCVTSRIDVDVFGAGPYELARVARIVIENDQKAFGIGDTDE